GDEFAVAQAAGAAGGVDADDPEPAEIALADAAVAEGEDAGADQRDLRLLDRVVPAQAEALGELQEPLSLADNGLAAAGADHDSDSGKSTHPALRVGFEFS